MDRLDLRSRRIRPRDFRLRVMNCWASTSIQHSLPNVNMPLGSGLTAFGLWKNSRSSPRCGGSHQMEWIEKNTPLMPAYAEFKNESVGTEAPDTFSSELRNGNTTEGLRKRRFLPSSVTGMLK